MTRCSRLRSRLPGLALAVALAVASAARGEVLPVRAYTSLEGLPHDRVKRIHEDGHGFLWFCTLEGLGRFDGRDFVTYDRRQGLEFPSANDLLLTPHGAWVATNGGGVAFFDPAAPNPEFHTISLGPDGASRVNVLHLDAGGTLWAGSDGGLFRMPRDLRPGASFERVPLHVPGVPEESVMVWSFLETPRGLLAGTRYGLVRVAPDGTLRRYPVAPTAPGIDIVTALSRDAEGRILAGHAEKGLFTLNEETLAIERHLGPADGLPIGSVNALLVQGDRLLVGTESGLAVVSAEGVTAYGTHEGLPSPRISSLLEDRDGAIWIGTFGNGVVQVSLSGDVLYRERDGLGEFVSSVFERRTGELCAISSGWTVSWPEGRRFRTVRPGLPESLDPLTWRIYQGALEDREGAFWFATRNGIFRFPKTARLADLEKTRPVANYTTADGLATNDVAQLLEDSRGDIWIGAFAPAEDPLTRYNRAAGRFERFGAKQGLPAIGSPWTLAEDAAGSVWIAFRDGTLARYKGGSFRVLSGTNGFPQALIVGFTSDLRGRLWAASVGHGLIRVDEPGAPEPKARVYGATEGVTAFHLNRLVADSEGRIVFGTSRELMRLDPETGAVMAIREARRIVGTQVYSALRDRAGNLWFASWHGLARLQKAASSPTRAPAIRLAAVHVSGSPRPVAGTGATELDLGELPHSANVSFEFFGLGLAGEPLLYEHLLEGLDRGWSPGRRERTVQYDHLADGTYRFLLRAVAAGGEMSPVARVSFRIRPPFFRRWWFLGLVALLLVGVGYAVEAVRWRQRRALDDVRARLAKDLHDDLGASLSRLSILSEVAARRERDGSSSRDIIETIGEVSRSVVERLADGIWAVDPRRDDLGSLGERLRLQAAEVLDPLGVSWRIEIPQGAAEVPLHPERRRHVYLLFKEALTNAARHSAARHLVLGVSVVEGDLSFTLHDDGRGFDTGLTSGERRLVGGNGLANMKTRAEALGGKLLVTSAPGKGTRITLKIPLTGA